MKRQWILLIHGLVVVGLCGVWPMQSSPVLSAQSLHFSAQEQQMRKTPLAKEPTAVSRKTVILVKVTHNANLRSGPGTQFPKVGFVAAGKTLTVTGMNPTEDWYQLESGEWIAAFLVEELSKIIGSTPTPTPTSTPRSGNLGLVATPSSTTTLTCMRPPDDMSRVVVNGETINARTYWMLLLAQQIYAGPGSMLRVIQGSYEPGLKESFGTHDGGGAVDISIRNPRNLEEILWDEAPKMVTAMRQAGFAAWYRPTGMFGANSGAHIHAIAIGDPEMSDAARHQLDGAEGYFRGLDGVPAEYGGPHLDQSGGPIVCPWMIEIGFKDLR